MWLGKGNPSGDDDLERLRLVAGNDDLDGIGAPRNGHQGCRGRRRVARDFYAGAKCRRDPSLRRVTVHFLPGATGLLLAS